MKKLFTFIAALMMAVTVSAADPVTLFGLISPLASYTGYERIDADFLSAESVMGIIGASELEREGFDLETIFSGDLAETASAVIDTALLGVSLSSASAIGSDGFVNVTAAMDSDLSFSAEIIYEDFRMLYAIGSRIESAAIDGSVEFFIDLSDEALLTVGVKTGDMVINGDSSYSNSSAEIKVFFDEEKTSEWLRYMGYDKSSIRYMTAAMIAESDEAAAFGIDVSSPDAMISYLEANNALDILDAAAFALTADSAPGMDEARIVSTALIPALYIDGKVSEAVDLRKLMDYALDIIYLSDSI